MITRPVGLGSRWLLVNSVVAGLLAVGCGEEPIDTSVATPPRTMVAEVAESGGGLVVVEGVLVARAGMVPLLCEALAESYPPQCAGVRVAVPELDVTRIDGTASNAEAPGGEQVVWTNRPITVTGRVEYGVLVFVDDPVSGEEPWVLVVADAGPACPVEIALPAPSRPQCGDRPVAGAGVELRDAEGRTAASTTTDALGVAVFSVPPGDYEVIASPVAGLVGTPGPRQVDVSTDTAVVSMPYDTGIR